MVANTHAAATIRKRLSEVSGELVAIEKRWRVLREEHHALSQTLRMFDPGADVAQIKPKRPYRRTWPRGGGTMSRFVMDALRLSGGPMGLSEVVAALGERVRTIPDAERRVLTTLNYLARSREVTAVDGKREAARWVLSLTGSEQR